MPYDLLRRCKQLHAQEGACLLLSLLLAALPYSLLLEASPLLEEIGLVVFVFTVHAT